MSFTAWKHTEKKGVVKKRLLLYTVFSFQGLIDQYPDYKGVLTNNIELVTTEKVSNGCSKAVKPIYGFAELNELGIQENEGTLLGGIGVFAKEAPIVCGGKNGRDNLKTCWEFNYKINK